jgi:hypothetical protein
VVTKLVEEASKEALAELGFKTFPVNLTYLTVRLRVGNSSITICILFLRTTSQFGCFYFCRGPAAPASGQLAASTVTEGTAKCTV